MAHEVAYQSIVEVERIRGPMRRATLPGRDTDVTFGMHGEIAEHYGVAPDAYPPDTTTLDFVVAAAVGLLTGTFGGALEARGVSASSGDLVGRGVGDIEKDGKVLVIRRIHVTYSLKGIADDKRKTVDRILGFHADYCPVARSVRDSIDITTEVEYVA